MAGRTGAGDEEIVISDPRAIRALAHPARVAVLERLFGGAVLTATECAAEAGLSPSAMSYHLRALERYGLIGRADPTGDGRERPWRALGRGMADQGRVHPRRTRRRDDALRPDDRPAPRGGARGP